MKILGSAILIVAVVVGIWLALESQTVGFEVPVGWTKFERSESQLCPSQKQSDGIRVSADLDGDGIKDEGQILKNATSGEHSIFAHLSTIKRTILVKKLGADLNLPTLDLQHSGEVQTACGKGYWGCKENEPSVLKLTNAALNVVYCETSDYVLVWNPDSQTFSEVWLSD